VHRHGTPGRRGRITRGGDSCAGPSAAVEEAPTYARPVDSAALPGAENEVAELLSDLIRIDTTNTGDTATGKGERAAAEWVAGKLDEVGIDSVIHESEPGRASLVARIAAGPRC
jgi:hypothetical protein